MGEEMTEYRVIDFDDSLQEHVVTFQHEGEGVVLSVPAVFEDDGETVDVESSNERIEDAIKQFIEPLVSVPDKPDENDTTIPPNYTWDLGDGEAHERAVRSQENAEPNTTEQI